MFTSRHQIARQNHRIHVANILTFTPGPAKYRVEMKPQAKDRWYDNVLLVRSHRTPRGAVIDGYGAMVEVWIEVESRITRRETCSVDTLSTTNHTFKWHELNLPLQEEGTEYNNSVKVTCRTFKYLGLAVTNQNYVNKDVNSKKVTAFWGIALCRLFEVNRRFRGAHCLHYQWEITLYLLSVTLILIEKHTTLWRLACVTLYEFTYILNIFSLMAVVTAAATAIESYLPFKMSGNYMYRVLWQSLTRRFLFMGFVY
jgi:hypothetical protein